VHGLRKAVTAERLAELFEQEVFKHAYVHHGLPKDIVSDRDVRFQSDFWKPFNDKLGIKLNMSTAKHPQTDGQTERANGILEDTLRHFEFVGPYQTNWDEYLAVAEFAINNAWSQSTQTTPFTRNYGQHPDTPVTLQLRAHNPAVN
jgi:transposase InsO family protein